MHHGVVGQYLAVHAAPHMHARAEDELPMGCDEHALYFNAEYTDLTQASVETC